MKKLLPFLFLSSAAIYSTTSALPVMARDCGLPTKKVEKVCVEGDFNCEKKLIEARLK